MIKIEEIYQNYIDDLGNQWKKDHPRDSRKYRASSSGMCARKIYFESIEKAETTEPIDPKTLRIMRLGEIVHRDVQQTLKESIEND